MRELSSRPIPSPRNPMSPDWNVNPASFVSEPTKRTPLPGAILLMQTRAVGLEPVERGFVSTEL